MSQTFTFDQRPSDARPDLDTNAAEISGPVQGDFARGQRHNVVTRRIRGDFATGMRTAGMLRTTGDFATGMRTLPRVATVGNFATGMRTNSAPVVHDAFTRPIDSLVLAA